MTVENGEGRVQHRLTAFAHTRGRVITADGLDLVCKNWTPRDPEPKGVMVIVHGYT